MAKVLFSPFNYDILRHSFTSLVEISILASLLVFFVCHLYNSHEEQRKARERVICHEFSCPSMNVFVGKYRKVAWL